MGFRYYFDSTYRCAPHEQSGGTCVHGLNPARDAGYLKLTSLINSVDTKNYWYWNNILEKSTMSELILGDSSFMKMLSSPHFKSQFELAHSMYQVSSLATLSNYKHLMPGDAKYILVGSLQPMLLTLKTAKNERREVTISKY